MTEFPISLEDLASLLETILVDRTIGISPALDPQFFLNAGQPGSGKTELNNITKRRLQDNVLECNADTLRNYHPDAIQILRDHELEYPDLTWPAADHWNKALIEAGKARHYHLLIETTLRNAVQAQDTLAAMKLNGYATHLQVLAVPYRWSWLGIHLRFESIKAKSTFARHVSDADLGDRLTQLQANLPVVLASPYLDGAAVYKRKLTANASPEHALELVTDQRNEVLGAFFKILEKPMDDDERNLFTLYCERIVQYLEDREAPVETILAFKNKASRLEQGE